MDFEFDAFAAENAMAIGIGRFDADRTAQLSFNTHAGHKLFERFSHGLSFVGDLAPPDVTDNNQPVVTTVAIRNNKVALG